MNLSAQDQVVSAICKEIEMRKEFVGKSEIETIYFGGGTPSLLTQFQLNRILETIHIHFSVAANPEITLEANPDDLTKENLEQLKNAGVNRLSIGTQSFNEDVLKWMNRSHTAAQSLDSIKLAGDAGFEDVSIDLIYGVPNVDENLWEETVLQAFELPINHLSAYSLTLEEKTPYDKLVKQEKYLPPPDGQARKNFLALIDIVKTKGWEHYEISNYCKNGNYSKHNTSYWQRKPYLGVGPSAHSYDGKIRTWNVRSNKEYLEKMESNGIYFESEVLSENDVYNETILTGLRTKWGVPKNHFNTESQDVINGFINNNWMHKDGESLLLTSEGMLYADQIASELFEV